MKDLTQRAKPWMPARDDRHPHIHDTSERVGALNHCGITKVPLTSVTTMLFLGRNELSPSGRHHFRGRIDDRNRRQCKRVSLTYCVFPSIDVANVWVLNLSLARYVHATGLPLSIIAKTQILWSIDVVHRCCAQRSTLQRSPVIATKPTIALVLSTSYIRAA